MIDIVIAAAEPSGDMLGAQLIRDIRQSRADIHFSGIGGKQMRAAGCDCIADISALSVMGYADAIKKLPRILPVRAKLLAHIKQCKPAMFIGVDAPDFNLAIAAHSRKIGIAAVQYGSPSIWMWRRRRIDKIAKAAEQVWCLFPFEPRYYENAPIKAQFVGHPLATTAAAQQQNKSHARQQLGICESAEVIALLPGSRMQELKQHLSLAAQIIGKLKCNNRVFITAAATAATRRQMQTALPDCIMANSATDALAAADIAAVKSGTVSLQAALIGTPMVVFYRPSTLAQMLAQMRKFYLPFFSLPNILAGRFVVPEMVGIAEAQADTIAAEIQKLSAEPQRRDIMRSAFADIRRALLSQTGAADVALAMLAKQ